MARRDDDDALSWGDDDPTLDDGIDRADDDADDEADAVAPAVLPAARPGGSVTATVTAPDGTVSTREVVHPHTDDRKSRHPKPVPAAGATQATEPAPLGNVALVTLGLLGGIYLLFAIGWFVAGSRLQAYAVLYAIEPIGYLVAWVLAILAPAVWFAAVLVFGRRRPVWLRILLLVLGALVLIPWPFLTIGAIA